MYEESLGLFHEVVKIDPNDRALRIMDFGVARNIQKSLINHWSQNRNPDVLKDVPPYKVRGTQGK